MMSSTAWASRVLSPATLHSVFDTVLRHCITRPKAAADRWPTLLILGCSTLWPRVVEPLDTVMGHCNRPATRLVCI
jgi:hypothetical protein